MSKTIPPTCPEPASGRTYWRSLDQLSDTPEFREWLHREFPAGASELTDPVTRRHFVKIMSASFALAGIGWGTTGCRRPVEHLVPFAKQPEGYVHGVPEYFATAMPTRTGALPLVAKSHDGRPVKLEGNLLYPDGNGGTDRFAQASILDLYDPDRARRFTHKGHSVTREAAEDFLAGLARSAAAARGAGLAFLMEPGTSPSRARLQKLGVGLLPEARWFTHDAVDAGAHIRAASRMFGRNVRPVFRFDRAEVIVSLDADFLGTEEEVHNHIRRFAVKRRLEKPEDGMSRLYVVESLMTLTGANADHRLRIPSSAVGKAAAALAAAAGVGQVSAEDIPGDAARWLVECANDLKAHAGRSLVVAGAGQPLAVHALAYAINAALGNVGRTVELLPAEAQSDSLAELVADLKSGRVKTLVVLGGNPAFTSPADLDFSGTLSAARKDGTTVLRLGYHERDETTPLCDWQLPAAHYLESWGDARTANGTLVPVQPLIAPLFGGLTELEVIARLLGARAAAGHEIVRETFASLVAGGDVEGQWRKFLHDGFLAASGLQPVVASLVTDAMLQAVAALKGDVAGQGKLEVVFRRDPKLDDGRFNNNGWMLELPDPITKITWDNVVLVSRATAAELGVANNDVVKVTLGSHSVEGPVWVQPGQADGTLGVSLGWGRSQTGRVGRGAGFNAYAIRPSASPHLALGVTVTRTGRTRTISCTQEHWAMEGRPIIREANLEQYRRNPRFVEALKLHEPPRPANAPEWPISLYPNPLDDPKFRSPFHQWGMSVDLNACVGCSACVLACQSENNIPIVGKDQVAKGREMHWLRLDRYYTTDKESFKPRASGFHAAPVNRKQQFESWIDDVQVITQPMMCHHCEAAPCESVCPVNATVHDSEGLNVMAYNRCVGTRYCSNNCPYKVRRFNFFDYNKRPIDQLYRGPFGRRKDDEWDLLRMSKNPEVTVRMRGVMEKCTFCTQRIEAAKIAQKIKAGPSGDVRVGTDSFTTACAQACPAGAIVFGNLADPDSHVNRLKAQTRDYAVLEFLLTKPRLTYLARVRNPNPKMPDYYEAPMSLQEYEAKNHVHDALAPRGAYGGQDAHPAAPADGKGGQH